MSETVRENQEEICNSLALGARGQNLGKWHSKCRRREVTIPAPHLCVFVHTHVYLCAQAYADVYISVWLCMCMLA